jgi:hypothetical protein
MTDEIVQPIIDRLIAAVDLNAQKQAAERIKELEAELAEERSEHRKLKEDVDALIEEAREEERDEAATLWPEWADKLLKILRAYGVPCDDEEGVDLPEELREWLSDYKHEIRQAALKGGERGGEAPDYGKLISEFQGQFPVTRKYLSEN